MQNYVKFLEEKVEWIALGLAALWVGWIAWAYAINTPVTKTVGSQIQTPGSIDTFIAKGEQQAMLDKINSNSKFEFRIENFVQEFVAAMQGPAPRFAVATPINSPPVAAVAIKPTQPDQEGPKKGLVEKLPDTIVVKMMEKISSGMCQAILDTPPAGAADGAAAPVPVRPVAGPAGAAANAQLLATAIDLVWVTIAGTIDSTEQVTMFQDAGVPANPPILRQPIFLELQLQRAEVLTGDDKTGEKLGDPVLVKALPLNDPPFDRAKPAQLEQFLDWAAKNQERILHPPFTYKVVNGDQWKLPAQGVVDVIAIDNQPVTPLVWDASAALQQLKACKTEAERKAFRDTLTSEQKQKLYLAEQEEKRKDNLTKRPPTVTPVRPGTGTGGRILPPRDAQDPRVLMEMYAQARPAGSYNEAEIIRARRRGTTPALTPNTPIYTPSAFQPGIAGAGQVWAHDNTAEPGRSYKYRLRVVLKNPVYNQKNAAAEELAKVVSLPTDPNAGWSEWSKTVVIPAMVKMQLVQAAYDKDNDKEQAQFQIWRWQNGQLNKAKTILLTPGDMVGNKDPKDKAGVDFTTGWTLVSVRKLGSSNFRVTLVDDAGRTQVRNLTTDQTNTEYRSLDAKLTPKAAQ